MIETIILVFILAKIKEVKIKQILKEWSFWPVIICSLIYIYLQRQVFLGDYSMVVYTNIYKVIYSISLFYLIYKYKIYKNGFIGMSFMFLGMALNEYVKYVNGGKMPVFPLLSIKTGYVKLSMFHTIDNIHILGDSSTKLSWLADKYDFGYCIMSPGDMFVRVFVFIVLYYSFKAHQQIHINIKTKGMVKVNEKAFY